MLNGGSWNEMDRFNNLIIRKSFVWRGEKERKKKTPIVTVFKLSQETGMPTQLYVRIQINIALGDISNMANTEYCSNQVIPLVWTEIVSKTRGGGR